MAIDEARIKCAQLLDPHAEAIHRANAHIVVDDIGLAHEVVDDRAAFRGFEVNSNTLLAALDAEQQPQLRSAHRVATIFLDLDHARAEIREEAIGERSRHIGAKVENQDTVERANSLRRRHCTAVPMWFAVTGCYTTAIRGFAVAVGEQECVVLAGCRNLAADFDGRALVLNQFAEHSLPVGCDVDESISFHLLEPQRVARPERRHTADLRLGEDVAPIAGSSRRLRGYSRLTSCAFAALPL